ncbi:hypothetical protein HYPSUDRAFT_54339 [Hypholoma sublateritium FD-334 SS-4]|uniref:Uncharacterized protein n=1 Tax=Hypholoma sublateritium (strain FD-334 SS-4) TaxID=945553 RepID=A0A0D2L821_HYPSF|nr:hypothetical protein HYPSUDRAFT_54339 [Hypholoma sublateritium FD-334 SS-4]
MLGGHLRAQPQPSSSSDLRCLICKASVPRKARAALGGETQPQNLMTPNQAQSHLDAPVKHNTLRVCVPRQEVPRRDTSSPAAVFWWAGDVLTPPEAAPSRPAPVSRAQAGILQRRSHNFALCAVAGDITQCDSTAPIKARAGRRCVTSEERACWLWMRSVRLQNMPRDPALCPSPMDCGFLVKGRALRRLCLGVARVHQSTEASSICCSDEIRWQHALRYRATNASFVHSIYLLERGWMTARTRWRNACGTQVLPSSYDVQRAQAMIGAESEIKARGGSNDGGSTLRRTRGLRVDDKQRVSELREQYSA